MLYTESQVAELPQHRFAHLLLDEANQVLTITLNRPEKRNALNETMVNELAFAITYAHHTDRIRLVVLQARGPVFCAGGDIHTLEGKPEGDNSGSTIPAPGKRVLVGELFNTLYKPSIAQVEGDVYAGGLLLLAGCTFVVACNDVKLGLPEVKRGIFPFQVMSSLLQLMPARKVLEWCILGYNLEVERAHEYGLISQVSIEETIGRDVQQLVERVLQNSPRAISMGLEAYDHIRTSSTSDQHEYLRDKLNEMMATNDAREGIQAFREKRQPVWPGN